MSSITISEQEFYQFGDFFYKKTGIKFDNTKRYFVDKRLIERIEATFHDNFRSYFMALRFDHDQAELEVLTNAMTVNETYFFREEYQFKCLVNSILPDLISRKKNNTPLRIWCIPSSSGEEAYSVAIYLTEHWPEIVNWDVEIISSDIDTNMLKKAKLGIYQPRAFQNVPERIKKKYFDKIGPDKFQIKSMFRDAVEFTNVNLNEPADTKPYRKFDVIFCRNLLIYFDDMSRKRAADVFYDALNPGGYICLGHSESMSRVSSLFDVKRLKDAIVYQKSEVK